MDSVLVIEDEEMLRSAVVRGLSKLPALVVSEARDLEQAVTLIDAAVPTLIVSDIDLPGRSGIELLGELGRRGLRIPVIFVSGFLKAYRSQIPQHADVEVMEKPVALDELRDVVQRRLAQSRRAQDMAPFSVADYLQLACMGRHSVHVTVHRDERELGHVAVWQGEVFYCRDVLGGGAEAFGRLAFASRTVVQCVTLSLKPTARNIDGNWEFLLMESARQRDESGGTDDPYEASPSSRVLSTRLGVAGNVEAPDGGKQERLEARLFSQAWEEGLEALLSKDYGKALSAFLRADQIRPGDNKVHTNIVRLRSMGIVSVSEAPPANYTKKDRAVNDQR